MVMPEHVCPFGLKARHLLRSEGYEVEDHWLRTREETDAFKARQHVETTPQTFIEGRRIGTYDDVRRFLGKTVKDPDTTSYVPVVAVFAVALLMAAAALLGSGRQLSAMHVVEWFIAFSMCLLAMLKLQDVESFSTMFLNYDLLARRWVPYAYVYPFAEFIAGVLMVSGRLPWISIPLAGFIGSVGAVSVIKAVYVERRELKCACVGGSSRVPLGFVSMTENLMMVGMAIRMAISS
jgi:glutaredoxin